MQINKMLWAASFGLALAVVPLTAAELTVYPNTPALTDTMGSVIGNQGASAPGFGNSSWQATGVKSNYYATPEQLFGHSVTVGQVASMDYWTNAGSYVGSSNWSLYIYTTPDGSSSNSSSWYKSRLVAVPGSDPDTWTDWTTAPGPDALNFSDPSRNNGTYTTSITWENLATGPVLWGSGTSRDYSSETIKFFSVQTDSSAHSFTGLVDGLTVNLDGESGSVNFEATPEPATYFLFGTALAGIGLIRRKIRS